MVCVGDDQVRTAMAKTVGLPAAIGARMVLEGKFESNGVVIPTIKEVYNPILDELKRYQIDFVEEKEVYDFV